MILEMPCGCVVHDYQVKDSTCVCDHWHVSRFCAMAKDQMEDNSVVAHQWLMRHYDTMPRVRHD